MHSALPQVNTDLNGKYSNGSIHNHHRTRFSRSWVSMIFGKSRDSMDEIRKIIVAGVVLIVVLYLLVFRGDDNINVNNYNYGRGGALIVGGGGKPSGWFSWFHNHDYYTGKVRTGAETMELSNSPYIYPDVSRLSEYRTSQLVTLTDGTVVNSRMHSIIYNPDDGSHPRVVMVTGLNSDEYSKEYLEMVINDRLQYAKQHGFGLYIRYIKDFVTELPTDTASAEDKAAAMSFAKVSLMREAMFAFDKSQWMWWLDQDAVIMKHDFDLEQELLDANNFDNYMIRDAPIIPPESIIHTYKRVGADQIKFIITQNDRGLSTASFLVTNDELYGRMLMGYWADPLHRTYSGFQSHVGPDGQLEASLTHMVQWHPAILSKMAVVSHQILGARPDEGKVLAGQKYEEGGFVYLVRSTNEAKFPGFDAINVEWKNANGLAKQIYS